MGKWEILCVRKIGNLMISDDYTYSHTVAMGWLRLVGSLKLWVSFAKEPYKRDGILQKRPMI